MSQNIHFNCWVYPLTDLEKSINEIYKAYGVKGQNLEENLGEVIVKQDMGDRYTIYTRRKDIHSLRYMCSVKNKDNIKKELKKCILKLSMS